MADIFGYKRNPKPRGVFSTEDSLLTFGSGQQGQILGYLVQGWNVSYQQQVQEVFEIGTNALYWAKGRPVGRGGLNRIIGDIDADSPQKGFFPAEAYDLCDGGALLAITAKGGHCEGQLDKQVKLNMDGCVVTSIGFSMQVNDVRLMENLAWQFASLEIK